MNYYSKTQNEAVMKRVIELPKSPDIVVGAIAAIAREEGVSTTTVNNWNSELKKKPSSLN